MVLLIILSIITSLLPPLALEQIVNHLTDQKEVSLFFALAYLGLIVLSDLFASAQNISITIFGQKLTRGMRSALVQKLNTITTGYLTNHESGAIASVFVNDADIINSLYSEGVVGMIADLFQLIGLLFVVFTRSIGLGFIILIVMPLILVMTRHFQKASLASQKQNRAAIAYVRQIFTPLESIGMEIQSIQDAMAGMSRIQDFLNEADSKPDIYQGEGD